MVSYLQREREDELHAEHVLHTMQTESKKLLVLGSVSVGRRDGWNERVVMVRMPQEVQPERTGRWHEPRERKKEHRTG